MPTNDPNPIDEILAWCNAVLGPSKALSDHTRHHPSDRTAAVRIDAPQGICYAKIHRTESSWAQEVHGYEQWARAFGSFAPRLLAVRDEPPLALVVSERPGKILEDIELDPDRERAVWRAAGEALVGLHELAFGEHFGPCRRAGYLSNAEQAVVRAAIDLTPVFAGQRPVPCHRDYCPANWLVAEDGVWAGVIDFEFAHWDVPAADFTRYPSWNWIERPDLTEAFFAGYGCLTPDAEQQRLVALATYAVSAIVWGSDNEYHGFAREGREALAHLAEQLA